MLTQQLIGVRLHQINIEWRIHVSLLAGKNGGANLRINNEITITSCGSGKARMKLVVNRLCPAHANIFWQVGVGTSCPLARTALNIRIKMYNLRRSVNAGVGSAGADGAHWMCRYTRKCVFQRLLDGWHCTLRLQLPTVVVAPVIFERERYAMV